MKEKLGVKDHLAGALGGTMHAFSMGQSMDTHVVDSSDEIGKLQAEIGEFKYRMHTTTSEPKPRQQKYKPNITPPPRRGGNFQGGGSFGNRGQGRPNMGGNRENQNNGGFRPRRQNFNNRGNRRYGQNQSQNFRVNDRFKGRGRFDNSPNV